MSSFERRGFADQLSIETPEQVALEFPVAGLGSRFLALLIDHLIQFGIVLALIILISVISAALVRRGVSTAAEKWLGAAVILALFLVFWCYYALFEAYWHGQTPGKRAMKLRVIKDTGRQITLFEALTRNLLRVVDYLPGFYLTGVITILCNQRNKRLGDLAAGTLVIHERSEAQPLLWTGVAPASSPFAPLTSTPAYEPWQTAVPPGGYLFPADAVGRLTREDLQVMETFFGRALDLSLETRAAMAARILAQMMGKMGVAMPEGNPERALEALAVQLRGQGRRL